MLSLILPVVIALSSPVGGEIFGDLRLGEKYLPQVKLDLKCGEEVVSGTTDADGSFRIRTKTGGKCTLTVNHDKQAPSVEVVVFEKPSRYRLQLEEKDGKFIVKRI